MTRFLIDECLTPFLVPTARDYGYEAFTLKSIGMASRSDADIADYACAQDLVIVTKNIDDYLRLYRKRDTHPGLLLIEDATTRVRQVLSFIALMAELEKQHSLRDHALTLRRSGRIELSPRIAHARGRDGI